MYYVCLKESGFTIMKFDREGFMASSKLSEGIPLGTELAAINFIAFLCDFTDRTLDDFYIQFYPEED